MKFLRITKHKDISLTRPPEKIAEDRTASLAYWDKYVKSGKLKELYWLPDGRAIAIWDFASYEEMARILAENPVGAFLDSETIPFWDYQDLVKLTKEASVAAKKAAKK